jgi:hypothetical protein
VVGSCEPDGNGVQGCGLDSSDSEGGLVVGCSEPDGNGIQGYGLD